jgi:hypothetical protein
MTTSLSFALFGSNQIQAADFALENIRRHYPEAYCVIISDAGADYSEISKKYQTEYFYFQKRLGYPSEPFGYRTAGVLEFFDRMYFACMRTNTSHIMYTEEDVVVLKKINIFPSDELVGYRTCYPNGSKFPNGFPEEFRRMIYNFSGKVPKTTSYGGQGGCILKVSTYLENYKKIRSFTEENLDYVQDCIYPTAGWIDCFITWFFLLAGKNQRFNPGFLDVDNNFDLNHAPDWVELANGYKKYYDRFLE